MPGPRKAAPVAKSVGGLKYFNPDFPDDLGDWARDSRRNAGNPGVSDESLPA